MSTNDPQAPSGGGLTRRQRREAERATRKSGRTRSTAGPAAPSAATKSSGPSTLLISIAAVAIGLVAVGALVILGGGLSSSEAAAVSKPDIPAPAQELRQGRTLVAPGVTPPVRIEAFEDPQCPACGQFTERIEPLIIAEHVQNGIASFTYNDYVFLGDDSWEAAIAMRVAEDMGGKFWDYHQVLFHNQAGENSGAFDRERLAEMAELVGLDRQEFLERMDDPVYRAAVAESNARAEELTVNSTPTLVVNGELVRGVPVWNELDAIVKAAAAVEG